MKLFRLVAAINAAGICAAPVLAQTQSLPEVTITASPFKLTVPAEEVAQTVSAISNADIENRSYRTVEEALSQVSSVQSGLAGRVGYDEFMIRGFFQSYYQFKNGLRLDPGYLQQEELHGLERIDVLKGPSSVEYGQIAPGGVVNMVSKTPQAEHIREVGFEAGRLDNYMFTADIGDRLSGSSEWTYRLPIALTDSRDYQDYVYSKRQYIAPTVAYRPTTRTSLVIFTSYQNDEFRRSVSVPYAISQYVNKSTYLGNPSLPTFTRPQTQLGYSFDHLFDDGLRFTQKLRQTNYDSTGTTFSPSYDSASPGVVSPNAYYFNRKVSILALDNQLEKEIKSGPLKHELMFGYDYLDYGVDKSSVSPTLADISYLSPVYETAVAPVLDYKGKDKISQQGLYGQYRVKFEDHYAASFGVRSSQVSNDSYDSAGLLSTATSLNRTTYSAGLMAIDFNGFSPFASYSQSFEPITGWDANMFDGSAKPTVSEGSQRELGVKWKSRDGRHTLVASYFDIYQTNVYNYVGYGIAGGCLIDGADCDAASDQRHKGLEIESSSNFKSGFDLKLSYTRLDAVIAQTQLASASGAVGSRPFGVPADTANATAVVHGALFGMKNFDFIVGARYVGDRTVNLAGDLLPSYTTLDLGFKYYVSKFTAYASIKNIADKDYLIGPYFGNVNFGAPRSISVGLKYEL